MSEDISAPSIMTDIDGFLAERMPGFSPRESQRKMTELIAEAIRTNTNALIEAGTGTGKTFAYLLPALSVDKRVIISTGTKNLQDQLYLTDLPLVNESFGRTTAVLKGRANYVCLQRLHQHINETSAYRSEELMHKLVEIYQWTTHTRTGDLTEVVDEEDMLDVQRLVTSTTDNCLGSECSFFDECHLYKARHRALEADVVVVNHHLFFADLALKEDDFAELLPHTDVVVLDEAHQVEQVARTFYGERLSSAQIFDLVNDVIREQRLLGQDDPLLISAAETLAKVTNELNQSIKTEDSLSIEDLIASELVESVDLAIGDLISRLGLVAERSQVLSRCYSRAGRLSDLFTLLTERSDDLEFAHWLDVRPSGFVIYLLPLDMSEFLTPLLEDQSRVWVLVSATLATTAAHKAEGVTDEQTFKHIKHALGFENGLEARFASPFDYQQQVAGFVPPLPDPRDDDHTSMLVASLLPMIRMHRGRSLLLFTSHRALSKAAEILQLEHDLAVMAQGALAKAKLIEKFRATEGAILLATHSFWEGVDFSGADLKLLAIDKLPFTSPDDPVFQARLNQVEANGGNSFTELSLPEAAVTLKQGFGRLVRQETDQGLFVLGDSRFRTKPYGKVLKKCLPEFNWVDDMETALTYLENLTS